MAQSSPATILPEDFGVFKVKGQLGFRQATLATEVFPALQQLTPVSDSVQMKEGKDGREEGGAGSLTANVARAGMYGQNPNPAGALTLKDHTSECNPEVREGDS